MQQLASRVGVDIAGSFVPRCREDVLSFLDTATFPVMLKAIDDAKLRRNLGATKFVIRSRQQLLALYDRVDDGGSPSLMLQEYIPGEDWMFNGYFNEQSDCLMGITGKKIRRFPVSTGVTSLGICLRNEVVEETTRRFMKAIGYRGILDIGYRYDYRNGQYRVLDVNPRIGCTFRLFVTSNGLDVARCLYLDLTGQPVTAAPATEGRKWMVEDFDIISALCCWRGGELTLANWVRSMAGVREAAFFALEDPLPLLPAGVSDIRELYRWLRRRRGARRNGKSPEPQADLVKTEAVRTEESGSLAKTR
jgi:predicted ATP-grasp superfamily ATP-dependent carboligase